VVDFFDGFYVDMLGFAEIVTHEPDRNTSPEEKTVVRKRLGKPGFVCFYLDTI